MVYIIKLLDHPKKGVSKIFVDYVDIVDKYIYNIIGIILQAPSREKQLIPKRRKYDKIIEVPSYWNWHLIEGKKVIIDQNKKIIAIVVEE